MNFYLVFAIIGPFFDGVGGDNPVIFYLIDSKMIVVTYPSLTRPPTASPKKL